MFTVISQPSGQTDIVIFVPGSLTPKAKPSLGVIYVVTFDGLQLGGQSRFPQTISSIVAPRYTQPYGDNQNRITA